MFDFLRYKILFEAQTPFNGRVLVVNAFGTMKLVADNVTQSADYLSSYARAGYWHKASEIIVRNKPAAKKVLFLGLGSGTTIHYISKSIPNARLTAVEIDPVMIDISKRFFGLAEVSNLEVINTDAFTFIKNAPSFDVLFVDLFRGGFFVPVADFDGFLKQLHVITAKGGFIIFNYAFKKIEAVEKIKEFTARMSVYFNNVNYAVVPGSAETSNYLIYGCK